MSPKSRHPGLLGLPCPAPPWVTSFWARVSPFHFKDTVFHTCGPRWRAVCPEGLSLGHRKCHVSICGQVCCAAFSPIVVDSIPQKSHLPGGGQMTRMLCVHLHGVWDSLPLILEESDRKVWSDQQRGPRRTRHCPAGPRETQKRPADLQVSSILRSLEPHQPDSCLVQPLRPACALSLRLCPASAPSGGVADPSGACFLLSLCGLLL